MGAAAAIMLAAGNAQGADPHDVARCQALFVAHAHQGLYFAATGDKPVPVNDTALAYDSGGRFYYLAPGYRGRTYVVTRERVWHVRTQTIARSAKANETLLWRPGVRTQCSPNQALDTFTPDTRFVSLQRYYDHHAPTDVRRPDGAIARNFHFVIDDPSRPARCNTRTDDPKTVGDLRETYGFPDVAPEATVVSRLVGPSPAVAATSAVYSGLSSELAIAAPGEPACFGFNAPLPTRSTLSAQLFGWWRNSEALSQAQTWAPSRTTISIQRIPRGTRSATMIVRWRE
jgi:hypothetical protein